MLKRYLFSSAIWAFVIFFWALPALAEMIVDTAWVRRYNGSGNGNDEVSAMAVDDSGKVYVTGHSFSTGTYDDYATIKYYSNGDTAWVRKYNGPGNGGDYACDIAVDDSGNVYVTGVSWVGWITDNDFTTIKYYPNGDTAWVRSYSGPPGSDDWASGIAIDGGSNIYVIGYIRDNGAAHFDYVTIKYYSNGDTAWVRRYNGPGNGDDMATAITIDCSNDIYVTGIVVGNGTERDYGTIKYHPDGDTAWVRIYDGGINWTDIANAIAIDRSGNIYVTGLSVGSGSYEDYATIKYYPNGDTAWVRRYNGPNNYSDEARAIAIDGFNNVLVTGNCYESSYNTIKYDSLGNLIYIATYFGAPYAIAVDYLNNVYITGTSWSNETYSDYSTIKYLPSGETAWVRGYYGIPDTTDDYAIAIDVDASGSVYVTGNSVGTGLNYDYATIKYVQFSCGDVNKDGVVDVGDVVYLINYLFKNGPAPNPLQAGDVNLDAVVDVGDIVYLINYLFKGGPPPCER